MANNKDKRCLICKYKYGNRHFDGKIKKAYFFAGTRKWMKINLCEKHDHQLFIEGQYKFLRSYLHIGANFVEYDSDYKNLITLFKVLRDFDENQKELRFARADLDL